MDQRPEGKQDGSHEGKWLQSCRNWHREPGLGAVSRWGTRSGSHEGRSRPSCSGSQGTWACGLTVVSVPGPAEVPEPPTAQPERGLIVLPQGGAVPQGEGGVLGTPVGDEAVLLASAGTGQGLCHGPAWMRGRKPMTQHPCRRTPHTGTRTMAKLASATVRAGALRNACQCWPPHSPTPAQWVLPAQLREGTGQWAQGVPTQASRREGCCSSHSHFPQDSRLLGFAMLTPHPTTSSVANLASPSLISLVHITSHPSWETSVTFAKVRGV